MHGSTYIYPQFPTVLFDITKDNLHLIITGTAQPGGPPHFFSVFGWKWGLGEGNGAIQ